jgi:SAM-dependent methyltransferase
LLTSDIYIQNEKTYFERILGDMNDMPFRQGVFDIVFVAASLHHSSRIHKTIRLIKHVLKPGGKLIVVNEPVVSIFSNREVKCPEVEHGVNEHVLWLWEYLLALRFAGFRYRLYPFIGSYQKFIDQKNQKILVNYPSLASKYSMIPPLLYAQLYFFGGILNLIAEIPE